MFAAVFFHGDKKFDVINTKKAKYIDDNKRQNLVINENVCVAYKTETIDDAGREKVFDKDYNGSIVYLNKDRSVVDGFLESGRDEILQAIQDGTLEEYVNTFNSRIKNQKRKSKKTDKMLSLLEENNIEGVLDGEQTSPKKKKKNTKTDQMSEGTYDENKTPKKKKKIQVSEKDESDKKEKSPKKKKKQTRVAEDSPSKSTRSKTATTETQKLQAFEYFKKKRRMQQSSCESTAKESADIEETDVEDDDKEQDPPKKDPAIAFKPQSLSIQQTSVSCQHQVSSQQQIPSQQQVSSQQQIPSQQQVSSEQHIPSQQQVSSQQQIPSQQQVSSQQQIPIQQQVSSQQQIPSQQQVSSQQQIPSQQQVSSHQQIPGQQQISSQQQIRGQQQITSQQQIPRQQQVASQQPISSQQQVASQQPIPSHQQFPSFQLQQFQSQHQSPVQQQSYNHPPFPVHFQSQPESNFQKQFLNMNHTQQTPLMFPIHYNQPQTQTNSTAEHTISQTKDNSFSNCCEEDPVSAALQGGLEALYGSACNCEKYRQKINALEAEVEELRNENDKLRENSGGNILNDLKRIISSYDHTDSHDTDSNISSMPEFIPIMSSPSTSRTYIRSSTPSRPVKTISRSSTPASPCEPECVDSIEAADGSFGKFFEPGENKVKLVDSGDLYIDAIKLKAIKNSSKGNPSRIVRELLAYYFTNEFLATHSATGQKSTKPALPEAIVQSIRVYFAVNYKMNAHTVNNIINRKCLDTKRKK